MFKKPSNIGDWKASHAILPLAEIHGNAVDIRNIRNFKYRTENDFDRGYYDKSFELEKMSQAYIGIIPFSKNPFIAHELVIFKFENGDSVVFSIEVRYKNGQKFSGWKTIFNNYELAYVIADPKDAIDLREKFRKNEPVQKYKLNLNKKQLAELFTDLCTRANLLAERPEFFNLFFNSCASNLVEHLERASGKKINWFYKYLAPGFLRSELQRKHLID